MKARACSSSRDQNAHQTKLDDYNHPPVLPPRTRAYEQCRDILVVTPEAHKASLRVHGTAGAWANPNFKHGFVMIDQTTSSSTRPEAQSKQKAEARTYSPSLRTIMVIYTSRYLDYVRTMALLLAATALCPGCFAVGSGEGECTEDGLLSGCLAPVTRSESPISSLDTLLQTQCIESMNGCPTVSTNRR